MIYELIGIKKEYDKDFSITDFLCAVDSVTTFFLTHSVEHLLIHAEFL